MFMRSISARGRAPGNCRLFSSQTIWMQITQNTPPLFKIMTQWPSMARSPGPKPRAPGQATGGL